MESIDLAARIRSHRAGHALERNFYTDPAIFERELQAVGAIDSGHAAAGESLEVLFQARRKFRPRVVRKMRTCAVGASAVSIVLGQCLVLGFVGGE